MGRIIGLDLRGFVWYVRCFWCNNLTPARPDPVCYSCLQQMEEWPVEEDESTAPDRAPE